jgi:hypothetical protein
MVKELDLFESNHGCVLSAFVQGSWNLDVTQCHDIEQCHGKVTLKDSALQTTLFVHA